MSLIRRCAAFVFALLLAGWAAVPPSSAQTRPRTGAARPPQRRAKDASKHANEAAQVLRQIMSVPDRAIPRDLIERAEAVVVCPDVLKAAFIVGGRKGDCVISRRRPKQGWGAPVFYNMTGGSVGLQIGGDKTDFVLLLMNPEALKGLTEDKFEIGGDAGRTLAASTNPTLDAGILTYSRSKGAFIGASLKGVAITPDNDLNEAFYGQKASALLAGGDTPVPSAVRAFPLQLSRYSVR